DPAAVAVDPQRLVRLRVVLDHQQLDVQDQVGDVVDHAGDRRKLVLNTQDLDPGDGAALQAREQDSPEAVAHGVAEAALEGLDVELSEGVGQGVAEANDPAGQFEATPTNTHRSLPHPKRRSARPGERSAQRLSSSMINWGVTGRPTSWAVGMRET